MSARVRVVPILALLPLVGACGYSFGVEQFGSGVRSVAIEVVQNRTLRQGFEVPLTRAIQRSIARHTDVRPTSSPQHADAVLRVSLDDIQGNVHVRGFNPPVREGLLDFQLTVQLVDRQGEVLRERKVRDQAEFRTAIGESEDSATAEALSDLGRKIVLALEGEF